MQKFKLFYLTFVGYSARWTRFHPEHWTTTDVSEWLEYVCRLHSIPTGDIPDLRDSFMTVDGQTLVSFDAEDFQQRTTKYGEFLRDIFETMCSDGNFFYHG